jgi:hypothetical protein
VSAYFRARGLTAATAATAGNAIAQVWNPSASRSIVVKELSLAFPAAPAAGAGFITRRSTARGTATATVTPGADHHDARLYAPNSGFLIDTAFSAQPTLAAAELSPSWVFAAVAGSGLIYPIPEGITIPPGTGLVLVNRAAIAVAAAEFGCVVDEL